MPGGVPRLLAALESWITDGVAPPASRYPSRADGTLGAPAHLYPPIPGLPYTGLYNPAQWVGPKPETRRVRAPTPCCCRRSIRRQHAGGGIRLPLIEAPRATYTAWNPTRGVAADTLQPEGRRPRLPRDAGGGQGANDPRVPLEERYRRGRLRRGGEGGGRADVAERTLLPADADAMEKAPGGAPGAVKPPAWEPAGVPAGSRIEQCR